VSNRFLNGQAEGKKKKGEGSRPRRSHVGNPGQEKRGLTADFGVSFGRSGKGKMEGEVESAKEGQKGGNWDLDLMADHFTAGAPSVGGWYPTILALLEDQYVRPCR